MLRHCRVFVVLQYRSIFMLIALIIPATEASITDTTVEAMTLLSHDDLHVAAVT